MAQRFCINSQNYVTWLSNIVFEPNGYYTFVLVQGTEQRIGCGSASTIRKALNSFKPEPNILINLDIQRIVETGNDLMLILVLGCILIIALYLKLA